MTTIIAREFSFAKDFRKISWLPTLRYNLLRTVCAGIVWMIFILVVGGGISQGDALLYPAMWPVAYLIFFLPMGIISSWLSPFVPFAGLFSCVCALFAVTLGDPIVCLVHRIYPNFVSVEEPPLFSTGLIHFVLDAPELTLTT